MATSRSKYPMLPPWENSVRSWKYVQRYTQHAFIQAVVCRQPACCTAPWEPRIVPFNAFGSITQVYRCTGCGEEAHQILNNVASCTFRCPDFSREEIVQRLLADLLNRDKRDHFLQAVLGNLIADGEISDEDLLAVGKLAMFQWTSEQILEACWDAWHWLRSTSYSILPRNKVLILETCWQLTYPSMVPVFTLVGTEKDLRYQQYPYVCVHPYTPSYLMIVCAQYKTLQRWNDAIALAAYLKEIPLFRSVSSPDIARIEGHRYVVLYCPLN